MYTIAIGRSLVIGVCRCLAHAALWEATVAVCSQIRPTATLTAYIKNTALQVSVHLMSMESNYVMDNCYRIFMQFLV